MEALTPYIPNADPLAFIHSPPCIPNADPPAFPMQTPLHSIQKFILTFTVDRQLKSSDFALKNVLLGQVLSNPK